MMRRLFGAGVVFAVALGAFASAAEAQAISNLEASRPIAMGRPWSS